MSGRGRIPSRPVVTRLDSTSPAVAEAIREVMVEAYRVEAAVLGVDDFVPLRRTAADITAADALFLGIESGESLAAVAEVEHPEPGHAHIGSLVVKPARFRQGLATALLDHLSTLHARDRITVSTGTRNAPACALYESHGFSEVRRWTTADGIPMVTFERLPEPSNG